MSIGTEIDLSGGKNFPLLQTIESENLNIMLELGRFYIKPRNYFMEGRVVQSVPDNPFYPTAGGEKGESYINPRLKEFKSDTLSTSAEGLTPQPLGFKNAPYCSFVDISMPPGETHPWYNYIKAPDDLPVVNYNADPLVFNDSFVSVTPNNDYTDSVLPNFVGKISDISIPATSKTQPSIESLDLKTITSYNFWSVDNLSNNATTGDFLYKKYAGYVFNSANNVQNAQPYAINRPEAELCYIEAHAPSSHISLTRRYPMTFDYAHSPDAQYYYVDGAFNATPTFVVKPAKLYNTDTPVGFSIDFNYINAPTVTTPAIIQTNDGITSNEPILIITWGDLSFNTNLEVRDSYVASGYVGLYTLVFYADKPPTLYFNTSTSAITDGYINPNNNSVVLKTLPRLGKPFTLYVFYSGQTMFVGSDPDPAKWQAIANPLLTFKNFFSQPTEFQHWLDRNSNINIYAQFLDFSFAYGPPLFTPYDKKNIPQQTNDEPVNGLDFFTGFVKVPTDSIDNMDTAETISDIIGTHALLTFQGEADQARNDSTFFGGASAYFDIRGVDTKFLTVLKAIPQADDTTFVFYKITFPENLGGNIFSKFLPRKETDESRIEESYVKYDIPLSSDSHASLSVSQILSQAITQLSVSNKVDDQTGTVLNSTLNISFVNLNKDDNGYKILQYMRNNICVLKLSAGFGDQLHVYFEGCITNITTKEALDKTSIEVTAIDLLTYLFMKKETMLISRTNMTFPGMRFYDMINSLVNKTELYKHFEYDLGEDDNTTIYSYLLHDELAGIPKVVQGLDLLQQSLATLRVIAYSTENSYLKVLSMVCQLCVQAKVLNTSERLTDGPKYKPDVPIMYWYANKIDASESSKPSELNPSDGIKISSRLLEKDKDFLFFRKENISLDLTESIHNIHGYLVGSEGNDFVFTSQSSTDLLFRQGIYFYIDRLQQQNIVVAPSDLQELIDEPLAIDGLKHNPYIGYDKIVMYSDVSRAGQTGQLDSLVMPNAERASQIINKWFQVYNNTAYETIDLTAYVTQPLKSWGHFQICIETSDTDQAMPDLYLYQEVTYNFSIYKNVIIATIKGSRKPFFADES